jgi:hypothetical protein
MFSYELTVATTNDYSKASSTTGETLLDSDAFGEFSLDKPIIGWD